MKQDKSAKKKNYELLHNLLYQASICSKHKVLDKINALTTCLEKKCPQYWSCLALMRAAFGAMERRSNSIIMCISAILATTSTLCTLCDARHSVKLWNFPKFMNKFEESNYLDNTNTEPYGILSPISLPPFQYLAPGPLPQCSPPFCTDAPFTPLPPSTILPSPTSYSPPPRTPGNVPTYFPTPPSGSIPSPVSNEHSPPGNLPSPPKHVSFPPASPELFPPPALPPPPHKNPHFAVWCVAKPTVPDSLIQAAMDYACGSGADCESIQANGSCYQPNTMLAHASYAFNSYWQNTKLRGGTCDFGGTAMLITDDPSTDSCNFINK